MDAHWTPEQEADAVRYVEEYLLNNTPQHSLPPMYHGAQQAVAQGAAPTSLMSQMANNYANIARTPDQHQTLLFPHPNMTNYNMQTPPTYNIPPAQGYGYQNPQTYSQHRSSLASSPVTPQQFSHHLAQNNIMPQHQVNVAANMNMRRQQQRQPQQPQGTALANPNFRPQQLSQSENATHAERLRQRQQLEHARRQQLQNAASGYQTHANMAANLGLHQQHPRVLQRPVDAEVLRQMYAQNAQQGEGYQHQLNGAANPGIHAQPPESVQRARAAAANRQREAQILAQSRALENAAMTTPVQQVPMAMQMQQPVGPEQYLHTPPSSVQRQPGHQAGRTNGSTVVQQNLQQAVAPGQYLYTPPHSVQRQPRLQGPRTNLVGATPQSLQRPFVPGQYLQTMPQSVQEPHESQGSRTNVTASAQKGVQQAVVPGQYLRTPPQTVQQQSALQGARVNGATAAVQSPQQPKVCPTGSPMPPTMPPSPTIPASATSKKRSASGEIQGSPPNKAQKMEQGTVKAETTLNEPKCAVFCAEYKRKASAPPEERAPKRVRIADDEDDEPIMISSRPCQQPLQTPTPGSLQPQLQQQSTSNQTPTPQYRHTGRPQRVAHPQRVSYALPAPTIRAHSEVASVIAGSSTLKAVYTQVATQVQSTLAPGQERIVHLMDLTEYLKKELIRNVQETDQRPWRPELPDSPKAGPKEMSTKSDSTISAEWDPCWNRISR